MPATRIDRGEANGVASLDDTARLLRDHLQNATETEKGIALLAMNSEVESASGDGVITAEQLTRRTATVDRAGAVELATVDEIVAGESSTLAITVANLWAALQQGIIDVAEDFTLIRTQSGSPPPAPVSAGEIVVGSFLHPSRLGYWTIDSVSQLSQSSRRVTSGSKNNPPSTTYYTRKWLMRATRQS